jgi:hypothetical protein
MFPEKEGIDYSLLQVTPEGEYSMTKRGDSIRIIEKMKEVIGTLDDKHITDLTGNVGGDTIMFGLHFNKVDSIEYNLDNFNALKNNVDVYNLKNVNLHFGDSTIVYTWNTDVLYIDPPWGGPGYKTHTNLDLFLGETRLDMFIKEILEQEWCPTCIFLKLPKNYNFKRLQFKGVIRHKFVIRSFILLAIETDFNSSTYSE